MSALRQHALWQTSVSLALCVLVELALRTRPLPCVADLLGVRLATSLTAVGQPAVLPYWVESRIRAVDRVLRFWPGGLERTCLRRSLVLGHRLRSLHPELVIGVRREGGEVRAHAWIVVLGGSLDPSAAHFHQLPRLTP